MTDRTPRRRKPEALHASAATAAAAMNFALRGAAGYEPLAAKETDDRDGDADGLELRELRQGPVDDGEPRRDLETNAGDDDQGEGDDEGEGLKGHHHDDRQTAEQGDQLWGIIPRNDAFNILVLTLLYFIQGIPLGLTLGAVPFLLKAQLTYTELGIFSLTSYPYSIKLLWSPLVDNYYFETQVGRRKTWIVPIQIIIGVTLFSMSFFVDDWLAHSRENITSITILFLVLVLLSATQDIAVDGWALTLLSKENISYASTCQTVGLQCGFFVSFTIFLALNSAGFCNKYLLWEPSEIGLVTVGSFAFFWSFAYFLVSFGILYVKEPIEKSHASGDVREAYLMLYRLIRLPAVLYLCGVWLICKVGFIVNDNILPLKLMEKGFKSEDMGLVSLINFPFEIIFGYLAARWSSGSQPLQPFLYSTFIRLGFVIIGLIVYHFGPTGELTTGYFWLIVTLSIVSSLPRTISFGSQASFFSKVADPLVGGTYMTLLNTVANLGGTWPQFFAYKAVDFFTDAECQFPSADPANATTKTTPFECATQAGKDLCTQSEGSCVVLQDGFYMSSYIAFAIGVFTTAFVLVRAVNRLERTPEAQWRLAPSRT